MNPVLEYESVESPSKHEVSVGLTDSLVDIICFSPATPKSFTSRSRGSVFCVRCSVTFSNKTNLNKHIRAFHPGAIKCDICSEPVLTDVDQHLRTVHNIILKHSKHIFKNEVDFQLWKVEEEKRSGAQYVSTSGTKKTPACVAKRYFICRRSGTFQSQRKLSGDTKRRCRSSVRCGVKCPARMTLTVDHSGKYLVSYQETHFGHEKDLSISLNGTSRRRKRFFPERLEYSSNLSEFECLQHNENVDESSEANAPEKEISNTLKMPSLHYLESLWELRNSKEFQNFNGRLHMHFDRKNETILVSEIGVVLSGILRPCFLSSILFYESRAPTITVRGVELLPGMFQVGDLRTASGFFGLLSAILNAPKCPGIADQSEVLFDDANGYLDTVCRWRHENCSIFSSGGAECDGCASLKELLQTVRREQLTHK